MANRRWRLGGGNTYVMDAKATEALLESGQLRPAARQAAERGKAHAESVAPVESGEYRDSFTVEDSTGWDGRAAVDLVNTSEHAAAVEYGNRGRRGRHILASTIDIIEAG